jgi:hypothetical protein
MLNPVSNGTTPHVARRFAAGQRMSCQELGSLNSGTEGLPSSGVVVARILFDFKI